MYITQKVYSMLNLKLKIMGIEAIKSSTPEVCRDKFKEIFKMIVTDTEENAQNFIKSL